MNILEIATVPGGAWLPAYSLTAAAAGAGQGKRGWDSGGGGWVSPYCTQRHK